jgi:hypothetical protein
MTIEATLERIAVALERLVEARPAAIEPKPPTQTVAPAGEDMAGFAAQGATTPAYAVVARKMADHPVFQLFAAKRLGVDPGGIQDAVAFALRFICDQCGVIGPQDFADQTIINRYLSLKREFDEFEASR